MSKLTFAFVAGIGSFFPYLFLGETVGLVPAFAFAAAYYFLCQFFLSRGHERAFPGDWRVMLALDASTFVVVVISDRQVLLEQSLPLLLCTLGGTIGGALAAAQAARSGRRGLWGSGPVPAVLPVAAGALAFGFAGLALLAMIGTALERHYHLAGMGKAGATAGLALGVALGAHLANRGRGRLGLVLAGSLAIGAAAWLVSMIPATIPGPGENGRIQLLILAVSLIAEVVAAVRIETAGAPAQSEGARRGVE